MVVILRLALLLLLVAEVEAVEHLERFIRD
jgi:hypothetical protein